jgi:hypothetical protein
MECEWLGGQERDRSSQMAAMHTPQKSAEKEIAARNPRKALSSGFSASAGGSV